MGPISSTSTARRPAMSIASLKARSRPIFQCRRRPNTSWSSISRRPKRLALQCHPPCSAAPMKVYTLGVLTLPNPDPLLKALREGLRDAGYVEGDNLRLEVRSAAGRPDLQLD